MINHARGLLLFGVVIGDLPPCLILVIAEEDACRQIGGRGAGFAGISPVSSYVSDAAMVLHAESDRERPAPPS